MHKELDYTISDYFVFTTVNFFLHSELQNQLSKLKSGQAQRSSGLFFNTSQTSSAGDGGLLEKLRQSFITSTFPFNNRISRNVSDISLCTLLERSSLGVPDSVYEED